MKTILFLSIILLICSCHQSEQFISTSSSTLSSSLTSSSSTLSISSTTTLSSSEAINNYQIIDSHNVKVKINNEIFKISASNVVVDSKIIINDDHYLKDENYQVGLLFINSNVSLKEISFYHDDINKYKPFLNSTIMMINSNINLTSCVFNLFSSSSCLFSLMYNSILNISDSDIVFKCNNSYLASYYQNKKDVTYKNCFRFLDGNNNQEKYLL